MLFSIVLSLLFVGRSLATQCNADNCLRALKGNAPTASAFCSSYTTATQTATTALPAYATACSNLPSRVSSACSCLVTSTPTPTCVPSTLQNTNFVTNQNGLPAPWVEMEHDASGQIYFPYNGVQGTTYYSKFLNVSKIPNYSYLTLQQDLSSICNGNYVVTYQQSVKVNSPPSNPSPFNQPLNCTITSGLRGYPASIFVNTVNYPSLTVTTVQNIFPLSGLPAGGASGTFFFDTLCTNVQFSPEIDIVAPDFRQY